MKMNSLEGLKKMIAKYSKRTNAGEFQPNKSWYNLYFSDNLAPQVDSSTNKEYSIRREP